MVEVQRVVSEGALKFTGLSTVYSYRSSQELQWAPDGAYFSYAREAGHESHIQAYDKIVDFLTKRLHNLDSSNGHSLGKEIWSQGLPLRFAGMS